MYFLYVLQSKVFRRTYIGITDSPQKRLKEHNAGQVKSTKFYRPYKLAYLENFSDKKEARKREIELKSHSQKKELLFKKIGLI